MRPETSGKIKFAVIGCGYIGLRHINIIQAHKECILTGLCDNHLIGVPGIDPLSVPFFREEDELMAMDFDVLCVATPNGLHERHALKALAGGHHVMIEKPMALTAASCARIIGEAEKRERLVFCVMQNRYSAPSIWLKDLLERKVLGKIFMVAVNCLWNRDDRYYQEGGWRGTRDLDGGVLFTQFSHFIDSLLWLFGDIDDIRAQLRNFAHAGNTDLEDSGTVHFTFREGGIGCLNFTTGVWQKNFESSLTVIAEKGTVKIGGQYMDEVLECNIDGYTRTGRRASVPPAGGNHACVYENVVSVLQRGGRQDIDPREAGHVVATIEQIYSRKIES